MSVGFLIEMGAKSLVISAVACLALWLLRSRSSADRAAMLRLTMALLLALPLISIALPGFQIERPDYGALVEALPSSRATATATATTDTTRDVSSGFESPALQDAPAPMSAERLMLLGYAAGLLLLLARLLVGLWTLRRWTAAAAPVTSPPWTAAFARASLRSRYAPHVRLLVSDAVSSPLSWGWRRPVILIDAGSLARARDADAILAHEIAHLARRDWPALMLSRVAVALFWFNPLVWLLERASIAQAEEAADVHALCWLDPVSYAQSLVACFRHAGHRNGWAPLPANGIASGHGIARRIHAILDDSRRGTPSGSVWTLAAMVACVALTTPVAALKLVAHPEPNAVAFDMAARRVPIAPLPLVAPLPPAVPKATGYKETVITIERRTGTVRVIDGEVIGPVPIVPALRTRGVRTTAITPVPPIPPVPPTPPASGMDVFEMDDPGSVTIGGMSPDIVRQARAAAHRDLAAAHSVQVQASGLRISAHALASAAMRDAAREVSRARRDVEDALQDLDQ